MNPISVLVHLPPGMFTATVEVHRMHTVRSDRSEILPEVSEGQGG